MQAQDRHKLPLSFCSLAPVLLWGINYCKDYSMITDWTFSSNIFAKITKVIGQIAETILFLWQVLIDWRRPVNHETGRLCSSYCWTLWLQRMTFSSPRNAIPECPETPPPPPPKKPFAGKFQRQNNCAIFLALEFSGFPSPHTCTPPNNPRRNPLDPSSPPSLPSPETPRPSKKPFAGKFQRQKNRAIFLALEFSGFPSPLQDILVVVVVVIVVVVVGVVVVVVGGVVVIIVVK